MSKHIEVIARGVCIQAGRLLVCRSKGAPNTYLPGGHVEFKERAEDGLRREILEEMGLDARVGRFLGGVEHAFIQKGRRHCEINLVFEMEVEGLDGEKTPASREDYIEFRWVDLRRLRYSRLEPSVLRATLMPWLRKTGSVSKWASTY